MNGHPGGEEHTRRMLQLAAIPAGGRILDLGAGAGESLLLMQSLGYRAEGIDLAPRSAEVRQGDLLRAPYPDGCFDGLLSQCAFTLSGDVPAAFRESFRLLKRGGALLFSDICFEDPVPLAEAAGFRVEYDEDLTCAWREYYLEAIWRGTAETCRIRGKCFYRMLICRKDDGNGLV